MKIIKDSTIYLVGELISKSFPFLLLPYLSRRLGAEGFGELSYLQTFIALFVIFIGLSQDGAVARYFYAYGKRSLNLIINTGYIYTLSLAGFCLVISWIIKSEILAYLILTATSQSILAVQLSLRQCQKRAFSYTIIQLSSTFLSALLTVIVLEYYSEDLAVKRIISILVSNVFIALLAHFFYFRSQRKRKISLIFFKKFLLYILAFGMPMILHHGSFFIKGQLDRIFIYHKFNDIDLGLYSMGVQLASILSVIILAVNRALVPYLFESLKSKKITLMSLQSWARYSFLLLPIPSLIVLVIPDSFFSWLLGEGFIGSKYYCVMFLLSYSLTIPYLLLVNYLFYHGKTKIISICSLLSVIVYVFSLMILILTEIRYVPLASILSSLSMLFFLYKQTSKIECSIN